MTDGNYRSVSMKTETSNIAVAVHEKRRERRYPTNDPAKIKVSPFTAAPVPAKIVDVSRSGMKLELNTPLQRESRIEVMMLTSKAVIFGEIRYCRRFGSVYHAGVLIEDVVQSKPDTKHLAEDEISLYVVGKGLTAAEVIHVEEHLLRCDSCKQRMVDTARELYPARRRANG